MSLIHKTFSEGKKIGSKEVIRWVTESPELREFFVFIEAGNKKIISK